MSENKEAKPNIDQMGGNITALKDDVKKAVEKIIALKAKRADVNAKVAEIRASMEAKGIPKKAFDAALRYFEMDTEQREGYDVAYSIAREGVGLPVQGEMEI